MVHPVPPVPPVSSPRPRPRGARALAGTLASCLLLGCGGAASSTAPSATPPTSPTAPTTPATPSVSAPDAARIDLARQYHEASGGNGLAVMVDGVLLHESYTSGGATTARLLASGTKGFTGLFGIMAAEDGLIALDSAVAGVVPEWRPDPLRSRILWRHLLTMTSGLDDVKKQDVWEDFLLAQAVAPPGTVFDYGSAPNVFGAALQRRLGAEKVEAYMQRRLFGPLGIDIRWGGSFADGNPQLSGGAYVPTRQWLNLGELVRLRGVWRGQRLVSEQGITTLLTGTSANPAYGFYWWLKKPVPPAVAASPQFERHIKALVEAAWLPEDFVMAAGAYEQRLYVIPSLRLVAARNGPTSAGGRFEDIQFMSRLLRGVAAP